MQPRERWQNESSQHTRKRATRRQKLETRKIFDCKKEFAKCLVGDSPCKEMKLNDKMNVIFLQAHSALMRQTFGRIYCVCFPRRFLVWNSFGHSCDWLEFARFLIFIRGIWTFLQGFRPVFGVITNFRLIAWHLLVILLWSSNLGEIWILRSLLGRLNFGRFLDLWPFAFALLKTSKRKNCLHLKERFNKEQIYPLPDEICAHVPLNLESLRLCRHFNLAFQGTFDKKTLE